MFLLFARSFWQKGSMFWLLGKNYSPNALMLD